MLTAFILIVCLPTLVYQVAKTQERVDALEARVKYLEEVLGHAGE